MFNIFKKTTWRPKSDLEIERYNNNEHVDVSLVNIKKTADSEDVYPIHKNTSVNRVRSDITKDKIKLAEKKISVNNKKIIQNNKVIDQNDNVIVEKKTSINKKSSSKNCDANLIEKNEKDKYDNQKTSAIVKPRFMRWSSLRISKKKNRPISAYGKADIQECLKDDKDAEAILRIRKITDLPRSKSNDSMLDCADVNHNDQCKRRHRKHEDEELHRTRAAVSVYVLDHLMSVKRQEMLENMYGGKKKSTDAAIKIQRWYRNILKRRHDKIVDLRKSSTNSGSQTSYKENRKSKKKSRSIRVSALSEYDPLDPFRLESNAERKRLFVIGVNLFNRSPNKGIDFLISNKILENDPSSIIRFFNSKGLSSYAKGDYLSQDNCELALETRREFIDEISFHNCSLEKSIRLLFSFIRIPGETQKILNMLEDFRDVYLGQNPDFESELKNPDSVVLMAFTILMLHTSLFNPSARKQDRMSKEQFISLFKNINDETFITEAYLTETYDSIKSKQMKPLKDHTDTVRNIYSHLNGPLLPKDLVQNHRKLVCQFNFNEVQNVTKKAGNHIHNREIFLFNDLLLITKKNNANTEFHVRYVIPLVVLQITEFQTPYYKYGITLIRTDAAKYSLHLNCINDDNRQKFITDCNEFIEEVVQLESVRANSVYRNSIKNGR